MLTHFWRVGKYLGGFKGQPCRVVCTGRRNSCLVEFGCGCRFVTIRYFVRRLS